MSDLTVTAAHYRRMASAEHKPGCHRRVAVRPWPHYAAARDVHPDPACPGCNPQADRDLFATLADEIDAHLAPQPDLFGGESTEPDHEESA